MKITSDLEHRYQSVLIAHKIQFLLLEEFLEKMAKDKENFSDEVRAWWHAREMRRDLEAAGELDTDEKLCKAGGM